MQLPVTPAHARTCPRVPARAHARLRVPAPQPANALTGFFLQWVLPFGLFIGLWFLLIRRMGPGQALSFGRSKARVQTLKLAAGRPPYLLAGFNLGVTV